MARFVEMPIAGGQRGQNVIVNIDLVRYIRSVKTGQATVYFDDDQSLTVDMDAGKSRKRQTELSCRDHCELIV